MNEGGEKGNKLQLPPIICTTATHDGNDHRDDDVDDESDLLTKVRPTTFFALRLHLFYFRKNFTFENVI